MDILNRTVYVLQGFEWELKTKGPQKGQVPGMIPKQLHKAKSFSLMTELCVYQNINFKPDLPSKLNLVNTQCDL